MNTLILLAISFSLLAAEGDPEAMDAAHLPRAEVLPLSLAPTLELNRTSQLLLNADEERQPERNQLLFQQHTFPWNVLAGLAILTTLTMGLTYVALRYGVYRRRPQPSIPPGKEALEALHGLESSHLASHGEFDAYYVQLTTIVRRYIERQLSLPASTQTTQEFLASAARDPSLNTEARQLLDDLLTYADQVKFAQKSSTEADCDLAFAYAREFLYITS